MWELIRNEEGNQFVDEEGHIEAIQSAIRGDIPLLAGDMLPDGEVIAGIPLIQVQLLFLQDDQ